MQAGATSHCIEPSRPSSKPATLATLECWKWKRWS